MLKKVKCYNESLKLVEDYVAEEITVNLYGNKKLITKLNCSPNNLRQLAIGYLISMGYTTYERIRSIDVRFPNIFTEFEHFKPKTKKTNVRFSLDKIFKLVELLSKSEIWNLTGCTHVAIVYSDGKTVFCEDVSRSCAIDKALGLSLENGINLNRSVLVVSCRISEVVVKKAANAGIPIIASKSAVTTAGLDLAEKMGLTILGFVRNGTAKIYTNPWRFDKV